MNISWTLFLLVTMVLCQKTHSGTICLSCNNLAEGELCTGNEVCKNDEVCFIQKYSTNGNENRYDVGCAYPELCQKDLTTHIIGRRSDHSHVLCHKCCNNTDVCNAHLSCNDKISVAMQKCLSCSEIEDPKMCKNVTTCAKDEICYLHKYTTHTNQQLFDVGCKHSALCTQGYSNILGRRSSVGVHQECESCCFGVEFCNHDLQCNHVPQKLINNTCSTTNECIGNLVCLSGSCKCPSDQYYWDVNTCYKRQHANERCTSDHQCKQSLSCEQNTCKCVVNKYWNGSLCEPKKTIHVTCSSSEECLDTLYCNHGYCKCDASVDYWNGSSCLTGKSANERCSEHSHCKTSLQCLHNVCVCKNTEFWNGYMCKLRKSHDLNCVSSDECLGTLFCNHGYCKCDRTDYWSGSLCAAKKSFNSKCTANEQCDNEYRCLNNICRCTQAEYLNGSHCLSKTNYNSICTIDEQCRDTLQCISNVCICIQTEYWNGTQCLSKKSINSTCNTNAQCNNKYRCIDNVCMCSQEEYLNGKQCLSKTNYNSICTIDEQCRDTLQCISNVCICIQTEYWNGTQCLSKKSINSTCNTNAQCNNKYRCIDNVCMCSQEEYLNGKQCLSRKSFNSTCSTNEQCKHNYHCIDHVCRCTEAQYLNGTECLSRLLECEDVEDTRDGVYTIYPGGEDRPLSVYCIMDQNKKWTVIQRRVNGSVDFYRTWQEYKYGFGSVYGEYWLGNENIHMISTNGHHELSIYMQAGSEHRTANYSTFSVGDERSIYRLTVTGYSGNSGGDNMDDHNAPGKANGQPFTTKDRDNDNAGNNNCAILYTSAWWYETCRHSDFNAPYRGSNGQMLWYTWRSNISKSILMIRRTS